ncbi:unnamed protein product [Microthlaspi erraticum]|uniref:Uncharacterized protein n=1 Tax=Microthlaspi erraticum TaxID=1685480 RepID=A0A6D2IGD8_9BRAS|nr:unnamed protein product [Microthlaspi erraticum]
MQTLSEDTSSIFTANEKAEWAEIYDWDDSMLCILGHLHLTTGCLQLTATMCLSSELSLSTSYLQESELILRLHRVYIRGFICGSWLVRFPTPPLPTSSRDSGTPGHRLHSPDLHGEFRAFSPTYKVLVRHKAKKGEIEDATGLTQIVNQSGSASGRMDGHVAELNGAKGLMLSWMRACSG